VTVIHLFGVRGILNLLASTNIYTMFGMSSLFSTHSVASNALARVFNFSTEVEHSNSREKSTFLVTMIFLIYSKPVKHGQSSSGSYGLKAVLLKD
jgi:hypothetical protein